MPRALMDLDNTKEKAMQNLSDETRYGEANGSKVLIAFLAGAIAGAMTALLTAPRSGRETRTRIRQLASEQAAKVSRARGAMVEATNAAKNAFTDAVSAGEDGGAHV